MIWKLLFFFFIHQNLYLLIRGLFFTTSLFFHTILLQKYYLNHYFEHLGGNDIFIIFWNSLAFFEDEKQYFYRPTDPSLFNRVG